MEDSSSVVLTSVIMWLGFICLIFVFRTLYRWAKQQKGAAIAIGLFIQMFLPDPKAQQTIEYVVEAKKEVSGEEQKDESDVGD